MQNNNWYFGKHLHIDFNNGINVSTNSSFSTDEGCAGISDINTGTTLFYTDGREVYDTNGNIIPGGTGLFGHPSSTCSAIIVPIMSNPDRYHIFTVDVVGATNSGLNFSTVDVNANIVAPVNSPLLPQATEKVAAVANGNCNGFWVIAMTMDPIPTFHIYDVDFNGNVTLTATAPTGRPLDSQGYLKISPLGDKLAYANFRNGTVEIFDFDLTTAAITFDETIPGLAYPYGLEFSNDGNLLYYSLVGFNSGALPGHIWQKQLNSNSAPVLVQTIPNLGGRYACGALQMAPDGSRIYVAIDSESRLDAILNPNGIGVACNYSPSDLTLPDQCVLGLPTQVQYRNCEREDPCEAVKTKVNELLAEKCENKVNTLEHCNDEDACDCDPTTGCETAEIPEFEPCVSIRWGDSECDCFESNDTEILCLTVCNCFSNITFKNLTIGCLEVCDADGNPVPTLPDGTPSVQLVPVGPHCFGDIEPCSCVSREFAIITCGAIAGTYQIKVRGICYDVCLHYSNEDCFNFTICKD